MVDDEETESWNGGVMVYRKNGMKKDGVLRDEACGGIVCSGNNRSR